MAGLRDVADFSASPSSFRRSAPASCQRPAAAAAPRPIASHDRILLSINSTERGGSVHTMMLGGAGRQRRARRAQP